MHLVLATSVATVLKNDGACYLTRPVERRGIHRQLNKGESINALEDAVFYGNEGRIRLQTLDRQSTQTAALALVSAAIVTWNTHHMNAIVERERAAGRLLDDIDLARLSPAIHAHINLNGVEALIARPSDSRWGPTDTIGLSAAMRPR